MNVFDIEELRERGLSDTALFPEDELVRAEQRVWEFIELFCGQFFEPRVFSNTATSAPYPAMQIDGTGRGLLSLPVPLLSLTSLTIDSTTITPSSVILYNRIYPEDRNSPKIGLTTASERSVFNSGDLNVIIEGVFGYVDKDQRPPRPLLDAAMKILLLEFAPLIGSAGYATPRRGNLVQEMSDDYMYRLNAGQAINGATGIPEIDKILFMYRRSGNMRGVVI